MMSNYRQCESLYITEFSEEKHLPTSKCLLFSSLETGGIFGANGDQVTNLELWLSHSKKVLVK